jgi:hypothetical protein
MARMYIIVHILQPIFNGLYHVREEHEKKIDRRTYVRACS